MNKQALIIIEVDVGDNEDNEEEKSAVESISTLISFLNDTTQWNVLDRNDLILHAHDVDMLNMEING